MKTALAGAPELPDGVVAELYTFTYKDGYIKFLTTADIDIVHQGHTYFHGVFSFERGSVRCESGTTVAETDVTIYAPEGALFKGDFTLPRLVNDGGFDGVKVTIKRARRDYTAHLFEGVVTDAKADRTSAVLTVSAGTVVLNIDMPRNLYQSGCAHTLFDSGCTLVKSSHAYGAAVHAGSTVRVLNTGLAYDESFFDLGTVTFTSGANNGVRRSIRNYSPGVIVLNFPLPFAPAVGDNFNAYPGCDKTKATCKDKFNNLPNFRGWPFMPVPESSV